MSSWTVNTVQLQIHELRFTFNTSSLWLVSSRFNSWVHEGWWMTIRVSNGFSNALRYVFRNDSPQVVTAISTAWDRRTMQCNRLMGSSVILVELQFTKKWFPIDLLNSLATWAKTSLAWKQPRSNPPSISLEMKESGSHRRCNYQTFRHRDDRLATSDNLKLGYVLSHFKLFSFWNRSHHSTGQNVWNSIAIMCARRHTCSSYD